MAPAPVLFPILASFWAAGSLICMRVDAIAHVSTVYVYPWQQATLWPPSDLKVSSQVACPTPRRTAWARVPRSKRGTGWVTSLGPWTRSGTRAPVKQVLLVHTLLSQRFLYVCFLAFLLYFIFWWRKVARGEPVKEPLKCWSQSRIPSCLDLWVEPAVCPAGSGTGLRNGPTIPGTC